MAEYKETKKHEKAEHKEMMQLRSGVFELKKELKKQAKSVSSYLCPRLKVVYSYLLYGNHS